MTNHLTGGPTVPLIENSTMYQSIVCLLPHLHAQYSKYTAGRCSRPARLTPTWRVIVRIEMEGGWYGLLPEASIARHAIEACGRGSGALRITARRVGDVYDSSRPAQHSCSLGSLDRTPATDFEEASGAAQAAPGIPVRCQREGTR